MGRQPKSEADRVHDRIAVLRADRGVSRRELADAVGVHPQTIGYLERGEYAPSLALALRIARFFDLPIEAIFSLDPLPSLSSELLRRTP
ncbi:DNA-binding transcriptional regulator, XRE-family HTH domain [Blastococcus aurantiacus]|uniref:DNA-binding transcriptional regulator, XRE-family HTH domain n=1 Tax=Blastococcus aurantiacus TaxID=1550231 RepID=A0A1G7LJJ0_9ACTN|nr:helix-turn-helix transcriptional regulator [Blastococcus aurantiacus]SDF49109.1 DNA-binding transcriptional regulator, XRE-family HTH domain [Blastococcus aurantiacus]